MIFSGPGFGRCPSSMRITEASCIEAAAARLRNFVHDARQAESVVRPVPREPASDRPAAIVEPMSVNSCDSFEPSATPVRARQLRFSSRIPRRIAR